VIVSSGMAVQLFFVLSGFLITGILLESKERPHYYRNFYMRRTLRIFPLYYASLVLVFFLILAEHGPYRFYLRRLPWLVTYTPNLMIAYTNNWSFVFPPSLGHFWSLAVEEQFYLFWPAIVASTSRRVLKWLCIFLIPGSLILRGLILVMYKNELAAEVLLPCEMDALALGSLLAIVSSEPTRKEKWLPIFLMFFGCGLWLISCFERNWLYFTGFAGFSIMSGGFILGAASGWFKILLSPLLRSFGKYSYSIYIFHVPILPLLEKVLHRNALGSLLFVILFVSICYVIGLGSWHFFELHFIRFKRFFPMTGETSPPPSYLKTNNDRA
jgi:peptidoglycan/LPS O-acetylase OafA/YrhL